MGLFKKVSIIALVLLLVGIAGSALTFKSMLNSTEIAKEKIIKNNQFNHIKVQSNNSKIEVIPTKDSTVKAELSGKISNSKKYTFEARVKGDTLEVLLKERQWKLINFDFFTTALTLTVYVPEKEYESIQLKSNNGRTLVEDLQAKNIDADTDNGRVELINIKGSAIKAKASNGRIDLINIDASNVAVKTDNGRIMLDRVKGKIIGKSNNGRISFVTDDLHQPVQFDTDNGKIDIQVEKEPKNVTFETSVDNGKIDIFGQSYRHHATVGDGEHLIKLTTNNGNITVSK